MTNKVSKSFLKDSHLIAELKLCSIRLIDNAKFPWIILIPKRKNINDISELNSKDQMLLMKEIVHCSKLMKKIFKTKKLNVEKLVTLFLNYTFISLQDLLKIVRGHYRFG